MYYCTVHCVTVVCTVRLYAVDWFAITEIVGRAFKIDEQKCECPIPPTIGEHCIDLMIDAVQYCRAESC